MKPITVSFFLLTTLLLIFGFGCIGDLQEEHKNQENLVSVALPNGTKFLVEIANTDQLREQGLMHRDHLPPDRGMLFVFEREQIWAFWMKNTLIPLDVIWMDSNGRIVDVAENMQPCKTAPCPLYYPTHVSLFALEISAGRYAEEGLQVGMKLVFPQLQNL